jgi:hypothetical protein
MSRIRPARKSGGRTTKLSASRPTAAACVRKAAAHQSAALSRLCHQLNDRKPAQSAQPNAPANIKVGTSRCIERQIVAFSHNSRRSFSVG